jgi:predicted CopG family antitoxin
MTNINISIKEEAYNYLKSLKGKDKSFSDVIIEIKEEGVTRKGSKERLMKYFGCLKESKNLQEIEENIKGFREEFNKRLDTTEKEMRKNDRP